MNTGVARPAAAHQDTGEPGKPPAANWLKMALTDDAAAPERAPAADAGEPFDVKALGLEPGPMTDQFSTLAGEIGLDRAGAERLVELHQSAVSEASQRFWEQQTADWDKQSRTQFGSRLPAMVNAVTPLLADPRLTPPEFRALLSQYGLGSNPHVIQTLNNWANAIRRGR